MPLSMKNIMYGKKHVYGIKNKFWITMEIEIFVLYFKENDPVWKILKLKDI